MPYATYLDLDAAGSRDLDRLTDRIDALGAGLSTPRSLGFGHHLTLAVYDDLDVDGMTEALPLVVDGLRSLTLTFPALEVFPGEQNVLFAAPCVTDDLLLIHRRYHRVTAALGNGRDHYHPGAWFPHVTLALDLCSAQLEATLAAISREWAPITCTIAAARLVRFSPVETIWRHTLDGGV